MSSDVVFEKSYFVTFVRARSSYVQFAQERIERESPNQKMKPYTQKEVHCKTAILILYPNYSYFQKSLPISGKHQSLPCVRGGVSRTG